MHLQEPEIFLGSQVMCFCGELSYQIETPTCIFYKEVYKQKWYRKGLLIVLEEFRDEYLQVSHQEFSAQTWRHEHNPQEPLRSRWSGKKGCWAISPDSTRVTPTVLLGSWVLQPIEDMMSLGTGFETHAKWQGFVEEPTAKDFVARKAHTIALREAQGTHWNGTKSKEHLGNCPEAVIRQASINLNSQVWKSLEDSLPELYCIDLAEAYVMQENVSSRMICEKKRYDSRLPNGYCMRNLRQKVERGKKTVNNSSTRFPRASCFEKTRDVCRKYGGTCTT